MADSSSDSKTGRGFGHYLVLGICALLLVGTLSALVLFHSAQKVALDPSFYKNELERAGVYDYAYLRLSASLKEQGGAQAEAILGVSGIAMEDVVTRAWIKTQGENLIDHALAYLNGQSATAELVIDLSEPKGKLYAAAQEKISQLPENAQAPATVALDQYKGEFDQRVPDRIDLAAQAGGAQGLDQARSGVETAKTATLGLLVISLVLAGIIVLLTRKRIHSMARWIGASLLVAGGVALVLLGVGKDQAGRMVSAFAQTNEGQIVAKIALDGAQAVNDAAFPFAAAFIVLGVIGIAASFLLPRAQAQPAGRKLKDEKKPTQ